MAANLSLLPAMVLHATMDLNLLVLSMAFLDPREGAPCPPAARPEGEPATGGSPSGGESSAVGY